MKFDHLKSEISFTAAPTDPEPHGREIFAHAIRGDFGPIADFAMSDMPQRGKDPIDLSPPEAWPSILDFIKQANMENASGTERGIILVWSSMIESLLGDLLVAFLVDHKLSYDLIHGDTNGPLSSFSNKSKMSFALGLISKHDFTICNHIRKIRNLAAHEWEISLQSDNFSKKAIPSLKALYSMDHSKLHEWTESDLRHMVQMYYAGSCGMLAMRLSERIIAVKTERRVALQNPNHIVSPET